MKMGRWIVLSLAAMVCTGAGAEPEGAPSIEVFKSPRCGCCGKWVEHLRRNGFRVETHDVADVGAARTRLGMPAEFAACHTARIGDYLVEGHVPAADIRRLLNDRPKALGLAVPGMPPGSPGMEGPSPVPYDTLLIGDDGFRAVFARH